MAWSSPSSRSHRSASSAAAAASWSGSVTSISSTSASTGSLRAVRRVSDSPRPAPLSTTSAPSCWAEPGHGEGQRGVGQDAGDQDALALEESHAPQGYCRTRGSTRAGPGDVRPRTVRRCAKVWRMRIGILGGTGPAGRGLAVRLAAAGDEVVIGSRDAERAAAVAARPGRGVARTARWPSAGRRNEEAPRADLVVVATPWDGAVATVRPLAGALAGKVVVSMANALVKEGREFLALDPAPGLGGRHRSRPPCPSRWWRRRSTTCRPRRWRSSTTPLAADVLVCSDHPEATEATVALVDRIDGLRARRRRQPLPGRGHRGVHRRAASRSTSATRSTPPCSWPGSPRHERPAVADDHLYDTARREVVPFEPGPAGHAVLVRDHPLRLGPPRPRRRST